MDTISNVSLGHLEKSYVTAQQNIQELGLIKYRQVLAQREEILTAFIAKYGCQPNEAVQEEHIDNATFTKTWHVRKMTETEKKRFLAEGI